MWCYLKWFRFQEILYLNSLQAKLEVKTKCSLKDKETKSFNILSDKYKDMNHRKKEW